MDLRLKELHNKLSLNLYNRKCYPKDLLTILEDCERDIINVVFEKNHGEKLYLDHVISHLTDLSVEKAIYENEEIQKMLYDLNSFKKYIKNLKKGKKGERFAINALKKLTIDSKIIKNIHLSYDELPSEDDLIVINENGLFIIEVKYRDKDMIITRDGFFVPAYNPYDSLGDSNVLDQISNERHVVINILSDRLSINEKKELDGKVHSILLFVNKDRRLYDESKSTNVLYTHNVASYISNYEPKQKLTGDEINSYFNVLSNSEEQKQYEIDFDLDELRESLVLGISLIEERRIDENIEINSTELKLSNISKEKWKFDWKSALIGSGGTCGVIGIFALCKRYNFKIKYIC